MSHKSKFDAHRESPKGTLGGGTPDGKLVSEHSAFVLRVANRLLAQAPRHLNLDDLIQCGYLGLLEAARTRRMTDSRKDRSYAQRRIWSAMIDAIRRATPGSRSVVSARRALNSAASQAEPVAPSSENLAESAESSQILRKALLSLSQKDRAIIDLYYRSEMKFREIGRLLNVSESRAHQLHTQAIRRLKRALAIRHAVCISKANPPTRPSRSI